MLQDGPLDPLGAGRCGQGAVKAPKLFSVNAVGQETVHKNSSVTGFVAISGPIASDKLLDEEVLSVTANLGVEHNS